MVWQILSRLLLGGVLVASAGAYEAVPVLICGLVVCGSAVPIAVKASRALHKGGLCTNDLAASLERRLAEFEDRNFQFLNELEDRCVERVEAVEERIDYTERLFARRNEVYVAESKPFRGLPMVTPI